MGIRLSPDEIVVLRSIDAVSGGYAPRRQLEGNLRDFGGITGGLSNILGELEGKSLAVRVMGTGSSAEYGLTTFGHSILDAINEGRDLKDWDYT